MRLILLIFSPDGWNYTVIYCKDHNSSHCNFSCCDEILTGVCTIQLSCRGGQCGAEPPCQTRRCSYNGACCSGCALLQSRPAFLCIKREWWATYKVWQYVAGMISNQQDGIPTPNTCQTHLSCLPGQFLPCSSVTAKGGQRYFQLSSQNCHQPAGCHLDKYLSFEGIFDLGQNNFATSNGQKEV